MSCAELDLLVDLARSGSDDGLVIGSRMTGGGFGGSTVTMLRREAASDVVQRIAGPYRERTGIEPTLFLTRPAPGARVLQEGGSSGEVP